MSDVTRILSSINAGDPRASDDLLPIVYSELRRLASHQLQTKSRDDSYQATELVHEAFLRLVDVNEQQSWDSRGHFFAAAAESMRRILVERARKRKRLKHGGGRQRVGLGDVPAGDGRSLVDVLALDEALQQMAAEYPRHADFVKLRYFAGLSLQDAGLAMGISRTTATRYWRFAKAWLLQAIAGSDPDVSAEAPS